MRRLALAGALLTTACLFVACAGGVPGVPWARTPAPQPASIAAALRTIELPPHALWLRGTVGARHKSGFILMMRSNRRITVIVGDAATTFGDERRGAYAEVVGDGRNPDRARYVSFWNAQPPAIAVTGSIAQATALGFRLDPASSAGVAVVLWSRTKAPALRLGDVVTVDGSGSPSRGVVADRISVDTSTPPPTPSASPSPSPTPVPTPPPTPTPKPTPTPTPGPTPTPVHLSPGEIVGADNRFDPPDSDSPSGGQSEPVDGIPCAPSMSENAYHVHAYVGILVGGTQIALPDQIGLYHPGPIVNGYTNTAQCYYYIHTHDASGMVHIESPSTAPLSDTLFTLGNVFDVWGMTASTGNIGPFNGKVRTFVANVPLGTTKVSGYSEYVGDPNAIPLQSHEAIWLEIGPPYVVPPYVPGVVFYTEY